MLPINKTYLTNACSYPTNNPQYIVIHYTGNGKIDEYTTKLGNLSKFNGSTLIDNAHSKYKDIKNFDGGSATFKNAVSNLNSIVSFKMPSALTEARSLMEEANAWTSKKF